MAVELPPHQFQICQAANGQFCTIPTPFQPLANPPTCISALYTRNSASITSRCSLQIKKTSDVSTPSQNQMFGFQLQHSLHQQAPSL